MQYSVSREQTLAPTKNRETLPRLHAISASRARQVSQTINPHGSRPVLVEPLAGLYRDKRKPAPGSANLLNVPKAQQWFELLKWGIANDLYTYQQPLDERSGPRVHVGGQPLLMLSSYDYLGLIGHPAIEAAAVGAVRKYGTGTGGARLLTGTTDLHGQLEHALAAFCGTECALSFGSGYGANLAAISALFGRDDRVFADAFAHRSIFDACRLAGVPVTRFPHNDVTALERELAHSSGAGRTLIIVEGVYSMDGDIVPLPDVVDLKNKYEAFLLVDEAHSLGVLGRSGRGVAEHFGLASDCADIWTGSLSKSLASTGGYVAGSRELIAYLQHEASPFVFSAALCPAAAAAALAAIDVINEEPERLDHLNDNARALRQGLGKAGYQTGSAKTPIIPVIVGDEGAAYQLARRLWSLGVFVSAVVHPAVPRGHARLRLCATAAQRSDDIDAGIEAFAQARPSRVLRE